MATVTVEVNGKRIESVKQLQDTLAQRPNEWAVSIKRGGEVLSITLGG